MDYGVPSIYARYLEKINASVLKLTDRDEIDESVFRDRIKMDKILKSNPFKSNVKQNTTRKFGRGGSQGYIP